MARKAPLIIGLAFIMMVATTSLSTATPLDDYVYSTTDKSYNWTDTGLRVHATLQGWTASHKSAEGFVD